MDVDQLLARANDSIHVQRVFGPPVERDGVLVIPAATVRGGGGGGDGRGAGPGGEGEGSGAGAGFGVHARPAGAFVVRDGEVRWEPAIDPNRIVAAAAAVAVVALLVHRSVRRSKLRRRT